MVNVRVSVLFAASVAFIVLVLALFASVLKSPVQDTRSLLRTEDYQKPIEEVSDALVAQYDCDNDLGQNIKADESVVLENDDYEIALDIPFNELWGGMRFDILPYEIVTTTHSPGVYFGPIKNGYSGCSFFRYFHLSTKKQVGASEFVDELKKYYKWDLDANYNELIALPKVEQVNGVTIASYQTGGSCIFNEVVIFGKTQNYGLSSACEAFVDMEELLKIARTVRFK